ncbi:MAG: hypothetical protein ACRCX2_34315 [Paraclostridium sp.]
MKNNIIRYSGENQVFQNLLKTDVKLISVRKVKKLIRGNGKSVFANYEIDVRYTHRSSTSTKYFTHLKDAKAFIKSISPTLLCSIDFRVNTTAIRIHQSETGKIIVEYRNSCDKYNALLRNSTGVFSHTTIKSKETDKFLGLNKKYKSKEQLGLFEGE